MDEPPKFACDAMMKGLARWLRACGYDATWTYGIDDDELLRQALHDGRIVLTADSGILARRVVKAGRPRAIAVPNDLPPRDQVRRILDVLALPLRPSCCMACGGALVAVPKESVRDEAPPRTYSAIDRFQRCQRCGRLLWKGTHWTRIDELLRGL